MKFLSLSVISILRLPEKLGVMHITAVAPPEPESGASQKNKTKILVFLYTVSYHIII